MDTIERFSRITTTAASSLKLRMLGIVPTTTPPPHTEDVASNSHHHKKHSAENPTDGSKRQDLIGVSSHLKTSSHNPH
jgi:hypothetical protein